VVEFLSYILLLGTVSITADLETTGGIREGKITDYYRKYEEAKKMVNDGISTGADSANKLLDAGRKNARGKEGLLGDLLSMPGTEMHLAEVH